MLLTILRVIANLFCTSVTCVIMQKNGAGLHTASSCFWDNQTDGKSLCVVWSPFVTHLFLLLIMNDKLTYVHLF